MGEARMAPIADTARFERKPSVIETDLETELVLLDPETREMYSLNPVGRVIWRQLSERTVSALAHHLTEVFDIAYDRALDDVRRLLAELLEVGLIVPANDAP